MYLPKITPRNFIQLHKGTTMQNNHTYSIIHKEKQLRKLKQKLATMLKTINNLKLSHKYTGEVHTLYKRFKTDIRIKQQHLTTDISVLKLKVAGEWNGSHV